VSGRAGRAVTLALAAALAGVGVLWAAALEDRWRPSWDAAQYLATAQNLLDGEGYRYQGWPFFVRLPGTALLLAPLIAVDGRAPRYEELDFVFLHAVFAALAAVGVLGTLALGRALLGTRVALGVALLLAVHPLWLGQLDQVLSEAPFAALFLPALALVSPRPDGRGPGRGARLLGAVLLAASIWVRTVGVLAVPFVVLALRDREGRRDPRGGLVLALLVLVLAAPWWIEASRRAAAAPRPATSRLVFDYGTAMLHADPGDPASPRLSASDWAARAGRNGPAWLAALGCGATGVTDKGPAAVAGALLTAVALCGLARAGWLVGGTLVAMLALLTSYFTFAERLLVPVVPLWLVALACGVRTLAGAWGRRAARPPAPDGLLAATGVLLLLGAAVGAPRALSPDPEKRVLWEHDEVAAAWIREHTPPDARVLHLRAAPFALMTGRHTETYRHLDDPWPRGAPPVDYVVLGPNSIDVDFEPAVRPHRVETWRLDVPGRADAKILVYEVEVPGS